MSFDDHTEVVDRLFGHLTDTSPMEAIGAHVQGQHNYETLFAPDAQADPFYVFKLD